MKLNNFNITEYISKGDLGKVCVIGVSFYGIYQVGKLAIENNYNELKLNIGKHINFELRKSPYYNELPIVDVEPVKVVA